MPKTVSKPTIKRRDMDAVLSCLVDDSIKPGDQSESLAKLVANDISYAGGVALREFRTAIEVVFDALSLDTGSSVLISALAHESYLSVLEKRGLEAVICDVDPHSAMLPIDVLENVGDDLSAIVIDSPFGIASSAPIFSDASVPMIEDVTYSLDGGTDEEHFRPTGRFVLLRLEEDCAITAGGGTLVLGRHTRAVGELRSSLARYSKHSVLGNLNSALGIVQFTHREEFVARRRHIAEVFVTSLARGRHLAPTGMSFDASSHVLFPVLLDGSMKETIRYAKSKGVATQAAVTESILSSSRVDTTQFPNARALSLRCLFFPLYPLMKREDVDRVAKVLATLP